MLIQFKTQSGTLAKELCEGGISISHQHCCAQLMQQNNIEAAAEQHAVYKSLRCSHIMILVIQYTAMIGQTMAVCEE